MKIANKPEDAKMNIEETNNEPELTISMPPLDEYNTKLRRKLLNQI